MRSCVEATMLFPALTVTTRVAFKLFALALSSKALLLDNSEVELIEQRSAEGSHQSWEIGIRSQALLTLTQSPYSLFNNSPLPPPSSSPPSSLGAVFSIAQSTVSALSNPGSAQSLDPDDLVAADPASIGIAVLLANWTHQGGGDYAAAATGELNFLYSGQVPKTSDGAWSHRRDQLQLWSDFIAMVPPFLAYYGAITSNATVLGEAYNQIKLYRNYLRDPSTGLWRHVVLGGGGRDPGLWATGNGWTTIGMLRVLSIIQRSGYSKSMKQQQQDLAGWTAEILSGVYQWNSGANLDPSTHLLPNYLSNPSTAGNFRDAASTALLAASAYRLSSLWGNSRFIPYAEGCREALFAVNSSSGGLVHFQDGWLTPVVDPYNVGSMGSQSPEAESFVLELLGAYSDWNATRSKKKKGEARMNRSTSMWTLLVMMLPWIPYVDTSW